MKAVRRSGSETNSLRSDMFRFLSDRHTAFMAASQADERQNLGGRILNCRSSERWNPVTFVVHDRPDIFCILQNFLRFA